MNPKILGAKNAKVLGTYFANKAGRPPQDGEAATGWIQLRVTLGRKNAYVAAAKPKKLSVWIFEQLDKASGHKPTDTL